MKFGLRKLAAFLMGISVAMSSGSSLAQCDGEADGGGGNSNVRLHYVWPRYSALEFQLFQQQIALQKQQRFALQQQALKFQQDRWIAAQQQKRWGVQQWLAKQKTEQDARIARADAKRAKRAQRVAELRMKNQAKVKKPAVEAATALHAVVNARGGVPEKLKER